MATYITRASRVADLQRNFEIWQTAVEATHDFLSDEDRAAIADLVRDKFLPNAELTVAVDDSDIAHGFLAATGDHIDALFVHADSRGKGIGSMLLEDFRAERDNVTVDVNEQNPQACKFYESKGFRTTGRSSLDDAGRPYPIVNLRWKS
ncbi:acetyltransferase [Shinella kummerowiae]|uniref:Acetyltransferase n=1 Tax=Shinella kummerowiae TaxID=417745 RepID=A0A6N8S515_9HYPH|nr:acetyltransferase [Shinella kummerowiae]MXN44124.1 acetyltransferase [Shinella kummerowiae]